MRFCGFVAGLCRSLEVVAILLGVATFLLGFLSFEVADSGRVMLSPSISTSTLGSTGDGAFELGAVLGFV